MGGVNAGAVEMALSSEAVCCGLQPNNTASSNNVPSNICFMIILIVDADYFSG
jgi:hypothetical protein